MRPGAHSNIPNIQKTFRSDWREERGGKQEAIFESNSQRVSSHRSLVVEAPTVIEIARLNLL